jgi:hypothetical protein
MSKILILIIAIFSISSAAAGSVNPKVYRADGNTPLEWADPNVPYVYPDIMVGTQLTIIVDSNVVQNWSGSLALADANMDYAVLSGREPLIVGDWTGSHYPAAGNEAAVFDWEETGIDGFDLYTDSTGVEEGRWFIIDYNSTEVGSCKISYYDHDFSWDEPVLYLSFTQVPTRDFNGDTFVDFLDFALFASYWQQTGCSEPGWCGGTDLDANSKVDANDLMLFCNYWLYQTN